MTRRDFLGEQFFKWAQQDYQQLREFRNKISDQRTRRPTAEEIAILKINKPWEAFYKAIL